jgi:hypothetical protein
LRVTRAGRVVLVVGAPRVVADPPVAVGGDVDRVVVSGAEVVGVSRWAPGGTEIAGGAPVLGGGGGAGGTGTICGPAVLDVVGGAVVVVRRRAERSDESFPHAATTNATANTTANQPRTLTTGVCPTGSHEGRQAQLGVDLLDRVADVDDAALEDLGA